MAYQSEVARMLLVAKPSPSAVMVGGGGGGGDPLHNRTFGSCSTSRIISASSSSSNSISNNSSSSGLLCQRSSIFTTTATTASHSNNSSGSTHSTTTAPGGGIGMGGMGGGSSSISSSSGTRGTVVSNSPNTTTRTACIGDYYNNSSSGSNILFPGKKKGSGGSGSDVGSSCASVLSRSSNGSSGSSLLWGGARPPPHRLFMGGGGGGAGAAAKKIGVGVGRIGGGGGGSSLIMSTSTNTTTATTTTTASTVTTTSSSVTAISTAATAAGSGVGLVGAAGAAAGAGGGGGSSTTTTLAMQREQQQTFEVYFRGQSTSIGFLISKILELLKQHAGRALHVKEVEKALIHAGFSSLHIFFQPNSEFLKMLSSNERVAYNPANRTLTFHNPYQAITSCNALLARIRYDGALTGLRVEQELLSAHAEMEQWIHALLVGRKVRAVRGNNNHLRGKKKCLLLGQGSQNNAASACDIYAARKCSHCRQNLVGLLLYPLADDIYEDARMSLDAEVKGLWDSIELPPVEEIVRECYPRRGLVRHSAGGLEATDRTRHKRQPDSKRAPRFRSKFRRIQNTHLFTAEELRAITDQHNA